MTSSAWAAQTLADQETGTAFEHLIGSLRGLQDSVTSTRPPAEVALAIAAELRAVAHRLDEFGVGEADQLAGAQMDYPGRSQACVPVLDHTAQSADEVRGTLQLSRFHLGRNGAAHGGVIPLVFDEIFGRLAGTDRPRCRTAFLHVDYREITPIGRRLDFTGRVERVDGRKIFVTGSLADGDAVVAEADALFVVLREGQP
ncbi:PaaI family thioesterase [Gordonia soli]|uniref:Acyl-coenzyme A thioesterase THEM4 n=1 Tax=Gordonia soli NBRC 108243 TaxID=1223545 RepID=M0QIV2_9ACTN|nr:PaaI family thioesterase [Gordonia soli]GAC68483.1 hypothetical protein GS4_16_00130 [Gordonia soli NBRC 108243]